MLKKYIFLFLFILGNKIFGASAVDISIDRIKSGGESAVNALSKTKESGASLALARLNAVLSIITIVGATYDVGCFVKSCICPTEEEENYRKYVKSKIGIIKAEKALYDCLIQNAGAKKDSKGLPCLCEESANLFIDLVGPEISNNVTDEFKMAVKRLKFTDDSFENQPKRGISLTKKVLIGSAITVGVAGAAIVAAPILFPGSIIAAKAAAITATAKTAAVATATKVVGVTKMAGSTFMAMDTMDKITTASSTIGWIYVGKFSVGVVRPYLYPTLKQELDQLIQEREKRKSLAEQIAEYHKKTTNSQ